VFLGRRRFRRAVADGRTAQVAELYAGPFLDGFHLTGAPEFERWVGAERRRRAEQVAAALELIIRDAVRRDDHECAVVAAKRLVSLDPPELARRGLADGRARGYR
jgi:serine/threonine-protein kinase